jgi:hypothetical protein
MICASSHGSRRLVALYSRRLPAFSPENFGVNTIVAELQRRGHKVTVLTGMPNYPLGVFVDGYGGWKVRESWNGCERDPDSYYIEGTQIHGFGLRDEKSYPTRQTAKMIHNASERPAMGPVCVRSRQLIRQRYCCRASRLPSARLQQLAHH